MTIKHLVFTGGGGHAVIKCIAAYQTLVAENFIDLSQIETIWGTSAGTIVATLIALKYDWNMINSYIIDRPWNELFCITIDRIFELYHKKGIYDIDILEKMFKPLFDVIDLSLDITLEEFYEFSKIEIHFSTFEINSFQLEDISYKTHPTLRLLQAIQMSCGLPVIITPVFIDDKIYIDGGIKTSYSLDKCIEYGCNTDEILGFKNKYNNETPIIKKESTLLDYILNLLFKIVQSVLSRSTAIIKYEIEFPPLFINFDILKECSENKELRQQLFDEGTEIATNYLSTVSKN
jgi:predicted acylesterase/phospholipase RssA